MYNQITAKINSILGNDHGLTLDDSEQSFVRLPTNHLNLTGYLFSINLGHVIYGNEVVYKDVMTNLKQLVSACNESVDATGDYLQIVYLQDSDQPWRVVFGGLDNDQQSFDFANVDQLLNKLKTFEF